MIDYKNLFCLLLLFIILGCANNSVTNKPDKIKQNNISFEKTKSKVITNQDSDERLPEASHNQEKSSKRKSSYSGQQVAIYALNMLEIGYTFGGKNPEAGLDCSGLVSYVFKNAVDRNMTGNAATIATRGVAIPLAQIRTGDLVFFNTTGKPYSHVGIYIGNNHFIHAPNSRGKVRVEKMSNSYYKSHFQEAREYFDD